MARKGFLGSGGSVGFLLLVLAVLFLVNFISERHFARLDLTQNKDYTVSKSTKKVLADLDDVVNVTVYFSKDLPPYLTTLDRQVKDLLDEYRAFAKGNLRIQFEDPGGDPAKERQLQMLGIPKVQLNILEKEKAQLTNVYLGMAVQYADKTEAIPVVQSADNLEYELTAAIIKVTEPQPKVAFLTGHGEPGFDRGQLSALSDALRKQYDVSQVNTSNGEAIPADVKTVVVVRPETRLGDRDRYELDQFLMRGGRLIFLADGTKLQPQTLTAQPLDSGYGDLLAHYGVRVDPSLIVDRSNVTTSFASGYMSFIIPYPWFPRILPENMDRKNPMMTGIESLVLNWASPLETTVRVDSTGAVPAGGVTADVLATSSDQSFVQSGSMNVNPQQRLAQPAKDEFRKRPVAVALTGSFDSYFAGRPAPAPADSAAAASAPTPTTVDKSPPTQIVVVGDADFAMDQAVQQYPQNLAFIHNAIDWCTMGDQLIAIRSRSGAVRPLKPVSDGVRSAVKLINMILVPLLVVLFGLGRWFLRKRSRGFLDKYRSAA